MGWIALTAVLALTVLVLGLSLLSPRRALREVAEELEEKLAADTNTLITLSTGDRAVRALAARINTQLHALRAERLRLRKKTSYSPWIFHDPLRPETLLNPGTAYRQLKKVLQETGLPELRFHDLRHTFATHALASGVDAKTLSGILGHTKASFTLDTYTHTTGDMQRRAAEIVGGFLTDYLGEEMAPWQNAENTATAASV